MKLRWLFKSIFKLFYKLNPDTLAWVIPLDDVVDLHYIVEKSYMDRHEFGTLITHYNEDGTKTSSNKLLNDFEVNKNDQYKKRTLREIVEEDPSILEGVPIQNIELFIKEYHKMNEVKYDG